MGANGSRFFWPSSCTDEVMGGMVNKRPGAAVYSPSSSISESSCNVRERRSALVADAAEAGREGGEVIRMLAPEREPPAPVRELRRYWDAG
jgi:hypothetical protein